MSSMKLMVCPHDTAGDPLKWFEFALYLTKYCKTSTTYYKCLDFVEFHEKMPTADMAYANPQDSLDLLQNHDFAPLVHSTNLYDEIVFIANNDVDSSSLEVLNGQECLSCNGMMVTRVGIKGLFDKNIKPSKIHSKDNWMAVVKAVSQGEQPYGFVYKDFYDGLNKLSKSMITKIGETTEQSIFHSVFIKSKHLDKADKLIEILTDAHDDEKGRFVLDSINVEKFIPVSKDEIMKFKDLLNLGSDLLS